MSKPTASSNELFANIDKAVELSRIQNLSIGIVMERYKLSANQARAVLSCICFTTSKSMRELCEGIIHDSGASIHQAYTRLLERIDGKVERLEAYRLELVTSDLVSENKQESSGADEKQ